MVGRRSTPSLCLCGDNSDSTGKSTTAAVTVTGDSRRSVEPKL